MPIHKNSWTPSQTIQYDSCEEPLYDNRFDQIPTKNRPTENESIYFGPGKEFSSIGRLETALFSASDEYHSFSIQLAQHKGTFHHLQ